MPGYVVDAGASIGCPHGGTASVTPRTTRVSLGGQPPLLPDDTAVISGCTFTVGTAPSPCVRLQWLAPSVRMTVGGSPVLLSSSVGMCLGATGAPQGTALVTGFQTRVRAT